MGVRGKGGAGRGVLRCRRVRGAGCGADARGPGAGRSAGTRVRSVSPPSGSRPPLRAGELLVRLTMELPGKRPPCPPPAPARPSPPGASRTGGGRERRRRGPWSQTRGAGSAPAGCRGAERELPFPLRSWTRARSLETRALSRSFFALGGSPRVRAAPREKCAPRGRDKFAAGGGEGICEPGAEPAQTFRGRTPN